MDCSPPGSPVNGILQARILEWVAIFFSRGSSQSQHQNVSSALQADFSTSEPPGKANYDAYKVSKTYIVTSKFNECSLNLINGSKVK